MSGFNLSISQNFKKLQLSHNDQQQHQQQQYQQQQQNMQYQQQDAQQHQQQHLQQQLPQTLRKNRNTLPKEKVTFGQVRILNDDNSPSIRVPKLPSLQPPPPTDPKNSQSLTNQPTEPSAVTSPSISPTNQRPRRGLSLPARSNFDLRDGLRVLRSNKISVSGFSNVNFRRKSVLVRDAISIADLKTRSKSLPSSHPFVMNILTLKNGSK